MTKNLNTLCAQIQEYIASRGLALFHGALGSSDHVMSSYWDSSGHPDYREYVAAAEAVGARMLTLCADEFRSGEIDEALQMLDEAGFDNAERRSIESRLRRMRAYDGFTCAVELAFDYAGRSYLFELNTEWHAEFLDLHDRISEAFADSHEASESGADNAQEDDDSPPFGSYFSKN